MVTEIDTRARERGLAAQESDPRFVQFLDSRSIDLRTGIENASDIFNQVEANIIAVNEAVNAIKAIPLLNLNYRLPDTTKLQEAQDSMAQIRELVTTFIDTTQNQRSDLIQGKVDSVTGVTTLLNDRLGLALTNLGELDSRLSEGSQSMVGLRERLPRLLKTMMILLNLLILLALLAFISLFLHAWQYFKCPEKGLGGLMPAECEKVPPFPETNKKKALARSDLPCQIVSDLATSCRTLTHRVRPVQA